jgi:hypothetical protein
MVEISPMTMPAFIDMLLSPAFLLLYSVKRRLAMRSARRKRHATKKPLVVILPTR